MAFLFQREGYSTKDGARVNFNVFIILGRTIKMEDYFIYSTREQPTEKQATQILPI